MLNVIYEDNHLLVVEKPVNILSQGDNTNDDDMVNLLKKYLKEKYNKPGNVFVGLVHRLDRPVGGIMVFAKTSKNTSSIGLNSLIFSFFSSRLNFCFMLSHLFSSANVCSNGKVVWTFPILTDLGNIPLCIF